MAQVFWTGNKSGDWGDTANWRNVTVPVSNDYVWITEPAKHDPTSGMDQSAIDLNRLTVGGNFDGKVGTPTNPLIIAADLLTMNAPKATLYINGALASPLEIDVTILTAGVMWAWYLDPPKIRVHGGHAFFEEASDATHMTVTGGEVRLRNFSLNRMIQSGGIVHNQAASAAASVDVLNLDITGGKHIAYGPVEGEGGLGQATGVTGIRIRGGEVDYRSSLDLLNFIELYAGKLTFANWAGHASNADGDLDVSEINWYGGDLDLRNGRANINVLAFNIMGDGDLPIRLDPNRKITISDQA